MSLLTMIQDAADRVGLARPSSVVSSSDLQVRQLLGLAQQEGKELAKRHSWQRLVSEKTFTSTATETQASVIPTDFDRYLDDTFFNRTRKRPVYGPLTAQEWQFSKGVVATTVVESWRRRGNAVMLTPTPTAGDTYAFEYVSVNWCQSSAESAQSAWTADTDTGLLSEETMTLGVMWRFLKAKGLDFAEDFRSYELRVAQEIARDGGKPTLNAGISANPLRAKSIYIPDGSWNL